MTRRTVTAALLALVFTLPLAAQAAAAPPAGIDWQADFHKALARAKKEKRPVMVAFVMRGESANEGICEEHFASEEIIERSRNFLCLLAMGRLTVPMADGEAASSDALVDGLSDRVSKKQLRMVEQEARLTLLESNEVSSPQFIFLRPDGESVLLRHVWALDVDDLARKMDMARAYHDPTFEAPPEVAEVKGEVAGLLKRCQDNNMNTRREAMQELATKDHPDVVSFLIAQTKRTVDQQKRLEAIRAMGQEGQAKFLPPLHALLKEPDYQIRTNVADSLGTIGLIESAPPLLKTVKTARKDVVRSLALRALARCAPKSEDTKKVFLKLLGRGKPVDKITILYIISSWPADTDFVKPVLKAAKASSDKVRAAAFLVIGKHKIEKATKLLKGRRSSERQAAKQACLWALKELGVAVDGTAEDPSSEVSRFLPSAAY